MKDKQIIATSKTAGNFVNASSRNERGFALVAALVIMVVLGVISATVLTFATAETRMADSDLNRTQTFYAAEAKSEDMNYQINNLFQSTVSPSNTVLNGIAANTTPAVKTFFDNKGYDFSGSTLSEDPVKAAQFKSIFGANQPFLRIPDGPYYGMSASVKPYVGFATATHRATGTKVTIKREINSYLIPIFQFSIFSDGDVELDPGAKMWIGGRVHANGNIYALQKLLFTGNITTAGELVRDVKRSGLVNPSKTETKDVKMRIAGPACPGDPKVCTVVIAADSNALGGSVDLGPKFSSTAGPGYYPGSPVGTLTSKKVSSVPWRNASLMPPTKDNDFGHFNNQLLTNSNFNILPLKLPLGVENVSPVELIKRRFPAVDSLYATIAEARYDTKAKVRILIDDEDIAGDNEAGIPAGKGLKLSDFVPSELCTQPCSAMRRFNEDGSYDNSIIGLLQKTDTAIPQSAQTVRGVKRTPQKVGNNFIPAGSGIKGRILIEVVKSCSTPPCPAVDVTQAILSMGVTVGEPNAIVRLQEPLWAVFMQNSLDRNNLTDANLDRGATLYNIQQELINKGWELDGEVEKLIKSDFNELGFITRLPLSSKYPDNTKPSLNEDKSTTIPVREYVSAPFPTLPVLPAHLAAGAGVNLNAIVPINVYNVREGWINDARNQHFAYKRGVTSVVDINMYNLRRWLDGRFDKNLLSATTNEGARGVNIGSDRGYVIYVSDRRGDRVKEEKISLSLGGGQKKSTNGNVDNEDVLFPPVSPATPDSVLVPPSEAGALSPEDVIVDSILTGDVATGGKNTGVLQKDLIELPDTLVTVAAPWDTDFPIPHPYVEGFEKRLTRAIKIAAWHNDGSDQQLPASVFPDKENYFRRSVRLSNGEKLATICTSKTIDGVLTYDCGANLSPTKGITVASENMVYIAGSYNTTGIGTYKSPNLNNGDYLGVQVPASIICDAFFPLSKTWFDANSMMYPEGLGLNANPDIGNDLYRVADTTKDSKKATAVRAAIMFGNTLSATKRVVANAAARSSDGIISSGGMHNAPRFLEQWNDGNFYTWSFSGSMVTLFNSTQAFAPWTSSAVIYQPPTRNWSYDDTLTNPNKLPPGTPFFQYVQSSGFQQVIEKQ